MLSLWPSSKRRVYSCWILLSGTARPSCLSLPAKIRWDSLLVLGFGFDILHGVTGLDLEGKGLAGQDLHKDVHLFAPLEEKERGYASEILSLGGLREAMLMGKPCSE